MKVRLRKPVTDTDRLNWMEKNARDLFATNERQRRLVLTWWRRNPLDGRSAAGQSLRDCVDQAMRQFSAKS